MKKHDNYCSSLEVPSTASAANREDELVMSGIIAKFSLQFELAWKLLKETLLYEGNVAAASGSPREVLKAAFATYDFISEDIWLEMLRARNDMAHIYDGDAAKRMVERIIDAYVPPSAASRAA